MRSLICILPFTLALLATRGIVAGDEPPAQRGPAVIKDTLPGGLAHSTWPFVRVAGKVTVKNGHTLVFADGTEVNLIDGPELEQKGKQGEHWFLAGREAADFLKQLIGDRTVTMYVNAGTEEYRRGEITTGACFVAETHLGFELLKNGLGIAHHSSTVSTEIVARENKRGLWRGEFVPPERWRMGERLPGEDSAATEQELAALRELGGRFQSEDGHAVALELTGDKLSDAALAHLEKLPHLRSLKIVDTGARPRITDAGLGHLAGLKALKSLEFSNLHGATDAGRVPLQELPLLENLRVTHSRSFTGTGFTPLRKLARLESLDFNHTPITDEGLAHLRDLAALKSLGLRATKITDAGLAHLAGLDNLEELNLWETQVTDNGLALVAKLPRIKHLLLVGASITADGLAHLRNMPALEDLEIRHVQGGDDAVLSQVGRLTRLKRLEFHGMQATEAGLKHLGKLTKLEVLLLVGSRIPDSGFAHLKDLTNLKELNLSRVPMTDQGLAHLKGFTALEKLYLSESRITDAGLAKLSGLTNLYILGLSDTQISDAGLEHLAQLINLRNLSLLHAPVTNAGITNLKAALPQLDIYYR